MPSFAQDDQGRQNQLLEKGGLTKETLRKRENVVKDFNAFLAQS
jgi:hypothetical protein